MTAWVAQQDSKKQKTKQLIGGGKKQDRLETTRQTMQRRPRYSIRSTGSKDSKMVPTEDSDKTSRDGKVLKGNIKGKGFLATVT
jgi:hypothetical protein